MRFAAAGLVPLFALWLHAAAGAQPAPMIHDQPPPVRLAMLGDSNTASFQDRVSHPRGPGFRENDYPGYVLQWGEVIGRLRPTELDMGPWEVSGVSNPRLRFMDILGLPVGRAPRKEDYRYNFANDGSGCDQLMVTRRRQVPRLVAMMDREPEAWRHGVVVIRVGVGDVGLWLDLEAQHPGSPQASAMLQGCMARFRESVALIRSHHSTAHIVLVGVFEDSHDALNLDRWQSPDELRNIARLCDTWDDGLRAIVAGDPHMSFFDDRAWFRQHWGGRDARGLPAYRTLTIGPWRVTHSLGDAPEHSMKADDHNGLVWNVLWAQAMVEHLRTRAAVPVTPISDEEVERFLRRHIPENN